ncbi:sensor histidine kinase [Tunicatimonas pelagia]|uniref:sensor histidine kinase n=1 Tax=Tunicatimonas pelagia TaxID=931531 RepID=UPI002665E91A|nr:histidine kinase dimerization/phosphoacceptor domain -containing protein [Tunicatimonas pelagia]WKN42454.1 histidine kinase dimerization/phosphoacceptor domain -containing protein [Tunicatimonas pelagia]
MIGDFFMHDTNILIVEDNAIAQLTFVQYLRDLDYHNVVVVNNGSEALDAVRTSTIDIAFLDIRIRGSMSGLETAQHIKDINPLLPFIFLTASTDQRTVRQALDCDPYSILNKPYDLATLQKTIEGAINYRECQEEASVLDTQSMLDQILNTTTVGVCITNDEGNFVKVNKAYCTIYGYSKPELIGQSITLVLPKNIHKYAQAQHQEYLAGGTEENSGEWQTIDKHGNFKDVSIQVGRLVGDNGQRFKLETVSDITKRKDDVRRLTQALDEKDSYAHEVHHRVKNNMTIVSGLLYLQAEKVKSQPFVYDLFQESMTRIKTLALIQEQLYRSDNYTFINLRNYIQSLVSNVQKLFREKAEEIHVEQEVTNKPLDVDRAIACGLIINEVITNSFKYAFPPTSTDSPKIHIQAFFKESCIHITIQDNGVGLPTEFNLIDGTTLGFQLISSLTRQLNGTISIDNQKGTQVYLKFPQ